MCIFLNLSSQGTPSPTAEKFKVQRGRNTLIGPALTLLELSDFGKRYILCYKTVLKGAVCSWSIVLPFYKDYIAFVFSYLIPCAIAIFDAWGSSLKIYFNRKNICSTGNKFVPSRPILSTETNYLDRVTSLERVSISLKCPMPFLPLSDVRAVLMCSFSGHLHICFHRFRQGTISTK